MSVATHAPWAPRVCLELFIPSPEAVACLAEPVARRLFCVPVARYKQSVMDNSDVLLIASAQSDDAVLLERLTHQIPHGVAVRLVLANKAQIPQALDKCYANAVQGTQLLLACSAYAHYDGEQELEKNLIVRLAEAILLCACRERASDIHLSPCSDGVRVRFRIDGLLCKRAVLREGLYAELLGRIKVIAKMDIAVSRQPQDGQFSQYIDNVLIDFRASVFPVINGENVVIRVLRPAVSAQGIRSLELPKPIQRQLLSCLYKPGGLVVFCGPTGSGKSTSLHALVSELDQDALNIMTLEDPVEKRMQGIQQTSVDSARSLGYEQGLRALLRQDPDVLLIGEVRDTRSCQMMLRAVMTGHKVLTTVHAGNVFGAIDRILELGIDRSMLASHLVCIAAQRLIRKLCCQCFGHSSACTLCFGTGYYGRQALLELLVVTPHIAALLDDGAALKVIQAEAEKSGFIPLEEQAAVLVKQGVSSHIELQRVFGV